MGEQSDVIVIGVGTGGEDLSLQLLDAGLSVVGIEASLVGGECPYWACIPSKMMIRAANLLQEARRVDGIAGTVEVTPDWSLVAARIRAEASGGWDDSVAVRRFEDRGGRLVHGRARFVGPMTVRVDELEVTAERAVVVATGSQPVIPPIPGLDEISVWTTHDVIAAEALPTSLLVLGGGAVGCELSQVLARFGTDVTIVEGQDRLLPAEEPEVGEVIEQVFADEGIGVRTGARVEQVAEHDGLVVATLTDGTTLAAERLLVATGRRVDTSGLGLDAAGITTSPSGFIDVDDRCRAATGVWAMGDVTGRAMFTHVAIHQGAVIRADILDEDPTPADYSTLPRVTFTDPEVGSAGLTEAEARADGIDVAVIVKPVPATFRGWLHAAGNAGVIKLVVDRSTGRLVGATSAGPHGGEVLAMLSTAIGAEVPVDRLRHMIYPYPTFHGGIGEAIGAYGRGIGSLLDPTPPLLDP